MNNLLKIQISGIAAFLLFFYCVNAESPEWSDNTTKLSSSQTYSPTTNYGFEVKWTDDNDTIGYDFSYIEHNFTGVLRNYTTFNLPNDTIEAYSYDGGWQTENQAIDGNFSTMDEVYLSQTTFIIENYTIHPNISANWTVKYDLWDCCDGIFGFFSQRCWNYTSNDWSNWAIGNKTVHVYKSYNIPMECLEQSPFILRTDLKSSGGSRVGYFEGKVDPTNGNITFYNYTGISAGTFQYRFYVNDSSDSWNKTDVWVFTVNKSTLTLNLSLNNTQGDKSYEYPAVINATGWKAVEGETLILLRNGTDVTNISGNSAYTIDSYLTVCVYNYTIYATQTNYTSTAVTRFATVRDTTTTTSVTAITPGGGSGGGGGVTTTTTPTTTTILTPTTTQAEIVCGNRVCDTRENCGNCLEDCPCGTGEECKNNVCAPIVMPSATTPVPLGVWFLVLIPVIGITVYVVYIVKKRRK